MSVDSEVVVMAVEELVMSCVLVIRAFVKTSNLKEVKWNLPNK